MSQSAKERYQLIDALRGLSILLMVGYHFGMQLIQFMDAPTGLINNPLLNLLQPIFAGLFILLSGMSARFSRSNINRGIKTMVCALLVSVAMAVAGFPVWFGILHFLGTAMLIYGLLQKWLEKVPGLLQPFLYGGLFTAAWFFFPRHAEGVDWALPFGFRDFKYPQYDYFPLLPWLFLFLFGAWLGGLAMEGKLPRWFYRFHMPVLPFIGRHTLLIYMAHQPIILGALLILKQITG